MSDVARCLCPHDSAGVKSGRNRVCPFHGDNDKSPKTPYVLTNKDRARLTAMRIAVTDTAAIEAVRKADEDRWRK